MACLCDTVFAADYIVDFTRTDDYENLRPLIQHCSDFGAMELYKDKMKSEPDLNGMREVFIRTGLSTFSGCPENITGAGISAFK